MRIKKNGKVLNLTESDLKRITKRFLNENTGTSEECTRCIKDSLGAKYTGLVDNVVEMIMKMEEPSITDIYTIIKGVEPLDVFTIAPKLMNCVDKCSVITSGGGIDNGNWPEM